MQFKQPEIFYALLLLLIPLLVHLFQLRRFVKIPFTNVAFLKEIQLKTRKSSQLKKWLVLALRSLALAALVTAFAQPFLSERQADDKQDEYVLYLDNSYGMNARGSQGSLLNNAVQQLYDNPPLSGKFRWFTNSNDYQSDSEIDLKNSLLEVTPTYKQYSFNEIVLKASGMYSQQDTNKKLLLISDFQASAFSDQDSTSGIEIEAVRLEAETAANISIDTAYIQKASSGSQLLKVGLSAASRSSANYPVSLWQDQNLIAKSAVSFEQQTQAEIEFPIDLEQEFLGRLTINDQDLEFDNELFFSIGSQQAIKVMSIDQADGSFLGKLFKTPDFELTQFDYNAADYNAILQQNVVVLNELESIPAGLTSALSRFQTSGGLIIIIPSVAAITSEYNSLLANLGAPELGQKITQSRKLTGINFDHPLYNGVFNQEVSNFQYPTINSFFRIQPTGNEALTLEGQSPYLTQFTGGYLFSAPLSEQESNFKESPLIVPTFFNMGRSALPLPVLYYEIGKQQEIGLAASLANDEIVSLNTDADQFIPLQQSFANKVILTTSDSPAEQGHYFALSQQDTLAVLSYNSPRTEAETAKYTANSIPATTFYDSVDELITELAEDRKERSLWQLFVALAVLFLIAEMAVLRFFK